MNWYLKVVRDNYANFQGRATRKEYWMFLLFNILFAVAAMIVDNMLGSVFTIGSGYDEVSLGYGWVYLIYGLVLLMPSWAVTVRRLHDTDRTGWWILFMIIPLIGVIVFTIFLCTDSTQGNNKYGPQPVKVFSTAQPYPAESASESTSNASADATVVEPEATVVESSVEPITLHIETGPNAGSFYIQYYILIIRSANRGIR
jgi:uncharacterized membrane protein YhaH (DUF805 family)